MTLQSLAKNNKLHLTNQTSLLQAPSVHRLPTFDYFPGTTIPITTQEVHVAFRREVLYVTVVRDARKAQYSRNASSPEL